MVELSAIFRYWAIFVMPKHERSVNRLMIIDLITKHLFQKSYASAKHNHYFVCVFFSLSASFSCPTQRTLAQQDKFNVKNHHHDSTHSGKNMFKLILIEADFFIYHPILLSLFFSLVFFLSPFFTIYFFIIHLQTNVTEQT